MQRHSVIESPHGMAEAWRLRALQGGARIPEAETPRISDEQVIDGLIAGEGWAAETLYDRLESVVERTLRRILRSKEADYDDLVQITFERVLKSLVARRFSGACSLDTWASAIAGHVGIDALRSRVRERHYFTCDQDGSSTFSGAPSPEDLQRKLEARSDIEQIQSILASMKPEQAQTIVLHDALGHELSEIAVLMGVSVAAAQSRLVRGRKELIRRAGTRLSRAP